jgi:hypothetical protein
MPSFQNADTSFFAEATGNPVRVVTPLTGATVVMAVTERSLYVKPAATIAALTIKLPNIGTPGQVVSFGFSQIVTTLTVQSASGGATLGALNPTANSTFAMCFVNATIGWVLWT